MSRAYRFTTNSRPADYRSGIRPMDEPCGLSAWGRALGLALLCAATFAAAALLLHAMGGGL